MDIPKSLREEEEVDEEVGQEEEKGAGSPQEVEDSEPMEEGGGGEGQLNDTWGDISFGRDVQDATPEVRGQQDVEVQMNWDICKYLPEAGYCQNAFQASDKGYFSSGLMVVVMLSSESLL